MKKIKIILLLCIGLFFILTLYSCKYMYKKILMPSDPQLAAAKEKLIALWQKKELPLSAALLHAFMLIPREHFTLAEYSKDAYLDKPLPILKGQTISQPSTVIRMLDALDVHSGQKILEIGAGSGYNAALLGTLTSPNGEVFSTEIIPELADFARQNIHKAGICNVTIVQTDGSQGCKKHAPYDRIIATAGAPRIPLNLIEQLTQGGILLIPTDANGYQNMFRITKEYDGLKIETLGHYQFVPLTGKYGK